MDLLLLRILDKEAVDDEFLTISLNESDDPDSSIFIFLGHSLTHRLFHFDVEYPKSEINGEGKVVVLKEGEYNKEEEKFDDTCCCQHLS